MDVYQQFYSRLKTAKACMTCRYFDTIDDDDRDEHCFVCTIFYPDLCEVLPQNLCVDFDDGKDIMREHDENYEARKYLEELSPSTPIEDEDEDNTCR